VDVVGGGKKKRGLEVNGIVRDTSPHHSYQSYVETEGDPISVFIITQKYDK